MLGHLFPKSGLVTLEHPSSDVGDNFQLVDHFLVLHSGCAGVFVIPKSVCSIVFVFVFHNTYLGSVLVSLCFVNFYFSNTQHKRMS